MNRLIITLAVAMGLVASSHAFAKKCSVVGVWKDANYGETFTMKSNKKGTAGANPLCSNGNSIISTTDLSKTTWDFNITSKSCSAVITADFTFDKGSCTAASGTLTIPGVGTLPDSITNTSGTVRRPSAVYNTLGNGLK
ncbi:MAG TPA: hypothetical protein VMB71_10960 [Acetobacteraceae bacterium]|nr:hypothetical protein [Acetobacteraceae bacterium]